LHGFEVVQDILHRGPSVEHESRFVGCAEQADFREVIEAIGIAPVLGVSDLLRLRVWSGSLEKGVNPELQRSY
jgi:hypothetical protein